MDAGFGFETDLRDSFGTVVVSHDPAVPEVERAADVLDALHKSLISTAGVLALNVKSDGLVPLLAPLVRALPDGRYFFFDMSWPQVLAYVEAGLPVALRVSEWEPLDMSLFARLGIPVRVWLDAFETDWFVNSPAIDDLCQRGLVAVVSPEIHRRDPLGVWDWFGDQVERGADVVLCTDLALDVVGRLT